MNRVDVVVTDLDGTLWRTEREIHPNVLQAWMALEDRGIPILAASGRRVASMRTSLARHGLEPAAVALNGAVGVHLASGERFHSRGFPPNAARAVLDAFRVSGLEPCLYVDHHVADVYVGSHPSTHPGHLLSLGASVQVADLDDAVGRLRVLGFGLVGCPMDQLQSVVEVLFGQAEAHLDRAFDYDGGSLTVAPLGLSKWDGVVAYCELRGIDVARVLAIGDGPNDIELLQHAAISVSLEGSHPAALKVADHVVRPVEAGGWASVLELV